MAASFHSQPGHARRRARHAFERGRLIAAVRASWPVDAWVVASIVLDPVAAVVIPGVVLVLVTIGAAWRGRSWRRGAALGSIVSFITWGLSAAMRAWRLDLGCVGCDAMRECALTCVSLSLLGGVGLGLLTLRDREPGAMCAAAIAAATLGSLMAHSATGLYSGAGAVIGYAIGVVPCMFASAHSQS